MSNRLPIYSLQINLSLNWKELDKLVQNLSNINTWSVFQALKNISRYPIIIQKKNIVIFRESNSLLSLQKKKKRKRENMNRYKKRHTVCLVVQVFKNVKANWYEELRKKGGQKEKGRKSKEKENWRERSII